MGGDYRRLDNPFVFRRPGGPRGVAYRNAVPSKCVSVAGVRCGFGPSESIKPRRSRTGARFAGVCNEPARMACSGVSKSRLGLSSTYRTTARPPKVVGNQDATAG